jgi:hypothetical protein
MIGQRLVTRLGLVVATVLAFAATSLSASAAPVAFGANGSEVVPAKHVEKGKQGKKAHKKHHKGKKHAGKKHQGKKDAG